MTFRRYTPDDKSSCLAMFIGNIPDFFAPDEIAAFSVYLGELPSAESPNASNNAYFVVEDAHGSIIASGGFHIDDSTSTESDEGGLHSPIAWLCWGMVTRQMHGQGIGRYLSLMRLQRIGATAPNITVMMDTSQRSLPFYEKLGFVVKQVTQNGYMPGLHRYDMMLHVDAAKQTIIAENLAALQFIDDEE